MSRYLTVVLAFVQAISVIMSLFRVRCPTKAFQRALIVLVLSAGRLFSVAGRADQRSGIGSDLFDHLQRYHRQSPQRSAYHVAVI